MFFGVWTSWLPWLVESLYSGESRDKAASFLTVVGFTFSPKRTSTASQNSLIKKELNQSKGERIVSHDICYVCIKIDLIIFRFRVSSEIIKMFSSAKFFRKLVTTNHHDHNVYATPLVIRAKIIIDKGASPTKAKSNPQRNARKPPEPANLTVPL